MKTYKQLLENTKLRKELSKTKIEIQQLEAEHRRGLTSAARHTQDSEDTSRSFEDRRFSQERAKAFEASAKTTEQVLASKHKKVAEISKTLLSGKTNIEEAKELFPQQRTGFEVPQGQLQVSIRQTTPNVYQAYHKNKRVGVAITNQDPNHGKFSVYKSETHPDYRQRGVMSNLYRYIEQTTGNQLHPSSILSDEGYKFWSKYRPEAVSDDLRAHTDKLMGKELVHPQYGRGTIQNVSASGVTVAMPSGQTFYQGKEKIQHLLGK